MVHSKIIVSENFSHNYRVRRPSNLGTELANLGIVAKCVWELKKLKDNLIGHILFIDEKNL